MNEEDTAEYETDHVSTRVVSRTFELDGVHFSWWAVDEAPSLVTVSSQWFGSKSHVTNSDAESTANRLAAMILAEHQEKAMQVRAMLARRSGRRTVS